ncbi:MAG: protein kinase family protein [Lachnospiraceae bacterium]|nr:protein kinase family protein [Lachnospiraceae bacterium]
MAKNDKKNVEHKRTKIGEGCSGTVYREWCEELERYVAVKVVDECPDRELEFMEVFRPFDVSSLLDCFVNEEGQYEIYMEYLSGRTMQEIIEEGTMDWMERLYILRNLCRSFETIKKAYEWMVFSDLKPSNIMVDMKGETTIIDLEDVVLVGDLDGDWKATPYYSAPEILRGTAYEESDLYNLGRTFEQMDWEVHLLFRMLLVRGCIKTNHLQRTPLRKVIHRLELYLAGYRSVKKIYRMLRKTGRHLIEIVVCICILVLGYDIIKFTLG